MRTLLPILLFSCTPALAQEQVVEALQPDQEVTASIKVREWNEFQQTQEEILTEQRRLFQTIGEVRNSIRQININLLSWQDAVQNAGIAGEDIHCDAFKTKYDPYIEWTVIGLAVYGLFSIFSLFFGARKKNA